jgi:hypothetical protein
MLLVAITLMVSVLPTHVCYTLEKETILYRLQGKPEAVALVT